jgi:hypothetical protein
MQTLWLRLNMILLMTLFYSLCIVITSEIVSSFRSFPELVVNKIKIDTVHSLSTREQRDRAILGVSFDADLSPAFNDMTTKMIFTWLQVDYSTKDYPRNTVILLDQIIQSREEAHFHAPNTVLAKYPIEDVGKNLLGVNMTMRMGYDVFPVAGYVYRSKIMPGGSDSVRMPQNYQLPPRR